MGPSGSHESVQKRARAVPNDRTDGGAEHSLDDGLQAAG